MDIAEEESNTKGGYASAYLNRWHLKAWKELCAKKGYKSWQYGKLVIIGHLASEGMIPDTDLERELEKLQDKKAPEAEPQKSTIEERRAARRRRRGVRG